MYSFSSSLGNVRVAMDLELNSKGWDFQKKIFTYWTTRMRSFKLFEADPKEFIQKTNFLHFEICHF